MCFIHDLFQIKLSQAVVYSTWVKIKYLNVTKFERKRYIFKFGGSFEEYC